MSELSSQISLFNGVDAAVEAALRLRPTSYRTKSSFLSLRQTASCAVDAKRMTENVHAAIQQNFVGVVANPARVSSLENWRLDKANTALSERNQSPEVLIERRFVKASKSAGSGDWWNQVPVASGLVSSSAGRRRAIDLVCRRADDAFDFIELKIGSNTPLHAAVEILEYGFAWLLSRQLREQLGFSHRSLLDATNVGLCVLAPEPFYGGVSLGWFEEGLNQAESP